MFHFNPIWITQREHKVGIFAAFQLRNEAFVLFTRELSSIVFEDGFCCFARGCVKKKSDCCHIFPKRFRYASHLLGQNPHAETAVAGTETKIYQVACAAFHVFRSGAVVKRASLLKKQTSKDEVGFHFVLLTVDNVNAWLVVHEAVVGFVKNKGWANGRDVIELTPERTAELI